MYEKYIKMYLNVGLMNGLRKIKSKVYTKIGKLSAEYITEKEPIPFEERAKLPLKKISEGKRWGGLFDCAWFNFTGKLPEGAKDKKVVFIINLDGEGCLFDSDGTPVKGLSVVCGGVDLFQPARGKKILDFTDKAIGGEDINIWVEAGHNKLTSNFKNYAIFKQADIAVMREDINDLYYDYLTLLMQLVTLEKDSEKYISIKKSLAATMKIIGNFSAENVALAREALASEFSYGEKSPYTFYATGHSHLDLAWLWPIRETKRKAGRTFANSLYNIEKYPEYIYGVSQPQQLEWMKNIYPKLYDRVKNAIQSGRIEPQGRMWVECDTNVTGGESLIRQSLYGNKFWNEEFGKTSKICWLPDVFGFSGNLPQIIKKCGMEYFLTIKLSWNMQNKFPHRTFLWEGIDNSTVLVHMPPEGTYNSDCTPIAHERGISRNSEKDIIKNASCLFGIGDGGGGPSEGHIECAIRQKDIMGGPNIKFSPAINLFEELENHKSGLKKFKGELYLEKHQGTLTTQGKSKYYNRITEISLHNLEFLGVLAHIKNGAEYPYDTLEKIWKEVLLYQFHDIIPGSSIKRVYDESIPRYKKINEDIAAMQEKILASIEGGEDKIYALNTTSYEREEYIAIDNKYYKAKVAPYSSMPLEEVKAPELKEMENDILKLDFYADGNIKSLYHKGLKKEFCGSYLNSLKVYYDKKLYYNAWDIDINYTKQEPKAFKLISVSVYNEGNSIIRESLYKYHKSTLTQKIVLTKGSPYVEFDNNIDWQETHHMLRAEFEPSVFSDEVTCDIQFGNIKRSTLNKTSVEKAQFEICAHKWIDVGDDNFGISLLNDCKYGHRVKDGKISLNLLRSPMYPAKNADKGIHNFRYALYPHAGNFNDGSVAKEGYSFNNPLIPCKKGFDSFITSTDSHIVIETVKMAENHRDEIIIRAYEDSGIERKADININTPFKKLYLTDMLENELLECSLENTCFSPYEIKTFKVIL